MKLRKIALPLALSLAVVGLASCTASEKSTDVKNGKEDIVNTNPSQSTDSGSTTNPGNNVVNDNTSSTNDNTNTNNSPIKVTNDEINITLPSSMNLVTKGTDMESLYAEVTGVKDATAYHAYVKKSSASNYTKIDDELIRCYKNGDSYKYRVDVVGLSVGTYDLKVTYVKSGSEEIGVELKNMNVLAYDRTGFAFSSASTLKTASGAYNDDGTLRAGAKVIYVTGNNAKTVKATVDGKEYTGLQAILEAKENKKSTEILDIRIVGTIYANQVDSFGSSEEGIQIKGAAAYQNMGITIEGIGNDATIHGFGFLIRNCGNVEVRNLGFMAFMDDGISIDTKNCNLWIHDNDIFYGSTGGDSDQAKGDGSLDTKGHSTYVTYSYNHFWDSGKCNLQGMKSESAEDTATYHHNWYDHSDSRHPRVRTCTVHVYNNYYDGNSKYGIGATMGSSIFSEANYFRNCKYPMLSSKQGNDALGDGTFSGEAGGMIKSYNDYITGGKGVIFYQDNNTSFDAYKASSRNETIASSIKTVSGATAYNNFDTASSMYSYTVDTPEVAKENTTNFAGRLGGGDFKWTFTAADDESYAVDPELKKAIVNYKNNDLVSTSITSASSTETNTENTGGAENTGGTETSTITTQDVIELINALPEASAVKSSDGAKIVEASNAYNSLSTDDKALVTNANKLIAVVNAYSSLGQTLTFNSGSKGDNSYFTVVGSLKSNVAAKTYDGTNYTSALKMESSTSIKFTATSKVSVLIITDTASKNIYINGTKYKTNSDGVVEVTLDAGVIEITKGDQMNCYAVIVRTAA